MNSTNDWFDVAAADSVRDGESIAAVAGSHEIALHRLGDEVFATDLYCTHGAARLCDGFVEGDGSIECPLHQGRFDLRTGKALCEPLQTDLATHAVRLEGARVWVRLRPTA